MRAVFSTNSAHQFNIAVRAASEANTVFRFASGAELVTAAYHGFLLGLVYAAQLPKKKSMWESRWLEARPPSIRIYEDEMSAWPSAFWERRHLNWPRSRREG